MKTGIKGSLCGAVLLGALWGPGAPTANGQEYNKAFLTDKQLRDTSWGVPAIKSFLQNKKSYFKDIVKDQDGTKFDLAQVISDAASAYNIGPKVLLATLQKECGGVTGASRPGTAIMGNSAKTWKDQVFQAAKMFDKYQRDLDAGGTTVSGWKKGKAKQTQDGVTVTPATNAVAGQFTYTPYVGVKWGGNKPGVGGVYLFYQAWNSFGF
jgi:hypothetical protein